MIHNGNYILGGPDGHTPIEEPNLYKWGHWYEEACKNGQRQVARTIIGDVHVSTVFLALNHRFFDKNGPPILFETMVFGGKYDQEMERYCTWDEAVLGHVKWCALVGPPEYFLTLELEVSV